MGKPNMEVSDIIYVWHHRQHETESQGSPYIHIWVWKGQMVRRNTFPSRFLVTRVRESIQWEPPHIIYVWHHRPHETESQGSPYIHIWVWNGQMVYWALIGHPRLVGERNGIWIERHQTDFRHQGADGFESGTARLESQGSPYMGIKGTRSHYGT